MSYCDELGIVRKVLVREYGPSIIQDRDDYCKCVLNSFSSAEIADGFVLPADRERFLNGEITAFNEGHIFDGFTWGGPELWNKFINWREKRGTDVSD